MPGMNMSINTTSNCDCCNNSSDSGPLAVSTMSAKGQMLWHI